MLSAAVVAVCTAMLWPGKSLGELIAEETASSLAPLAPLPSPPLPLPQADRTKTATSARQSKIVVFFFISILLLKYSKFSE
jgi:hypothetical protein